MLKYKWHLLIIICAGIQFIPAHKNNGTTDGEESFTSSFTIPLNIVKLLKRGCYDCHSNQTIYPWYSEVQPMSYFISQHIEDGKLELNFSEFGNYSERRKQSKLQSIISQIEDSKMPPIEYRFFHTDASFTENEKKELIKFFKSLSD